MSALPSIEDNPLRQRILDTAEGILRRHGVDKANVVDVARALGMSHGNIYRHFASKRALLEAVAERCMHAFTDPLEAIAADSSRPASERLVDWVRTLRRGKQTIVAEDPELFRVYTAVAAAAAEDAAGIVARHVGHLIEQLRQIIDDGVTSGEFAPATDAPAAARAFLQATYAFHHPALLTSPSAPADGDLDALLDLLLAGLRAGSAHVR